MYAAVPFARLMWLLCAHEGTSVAAITSLPADPVARAGVPARVQAIAPMAIERAGHSATQLPNGQVLIVGGFTATDQRLVSAELFDARSERFTAVPGLRTPRHSHTATLLPNGKVLIAGGYTAAGASLHTAELFDPATRTFTTTGALNTARAGHVAALLPNGQLLLAGGVGTGWTFLTSSELYNPATGQFTPTGDMRVPRESHIAVALRDGRVLIVGGHRGRRANITLYATAEVYHHTTGRFTAVGSMSVRRHKHDAVLLSDGRVLVTGGADERDDRGSYTSTELFDPASNRFTPSTPLALARYKHQGTSVVLPSGQVLLTGGAKQAELFDVAAGHSTLVPGDVPLAGSFSAAALLPSGGVLITGGYGNDMGPRAAAWIYRP